MSIDEILKEIVVLKDMLGSGVYDQEAALDRIHAGVSTLADHQPDGMSFDEWRMQQSPEVLRSETAWQTAERAFNAARAMRRESAQPVELPHEDVVQYLADFLLNLPLTNNCRTAARDILIHLQDRLPKRESSEPDALDDVLKSIVDTLTAIRNATDTLPNSAERNTIWTNAVMLLTMLAQATPSNEIEVQEGK